MAQLVQMTEHLFASWRAGLLVLFAAGTFSLIGTSGGIAGAEKVREELAKLLLVIATPITQRGHDEHIAIRALSSEQLS